MRSETCRKGEIAKCAVLKRAYEKDIVVSIPTIDTDYDAVMEVEGRLLRVQVKYIDACAKNNGSVELGLRRTTRNRKVLLYSREEIDAIVAYIPSVDKVIWMPHELWDGRSSMTIRISPTKNNQKSRVVMLDDYLW